MTAWVPVVRQVNDGEDVNASVTNRAIADLSNRTLHLKEIIDNISADEKIVIRDATIEAGVLAGNWVYYDSLTQQYRKAISEVLVDVDGPYTGPRSFVVGFIETLTSPTVGNIVTWGFHRDTGGLFSLLDAGQYYLSETVAGEITQDLPTVPIIVMIKNSNDTVQVIIDTKDLVNSSDATYTFAVTSVATANTNLVVTGCEDGQPVPPGPLVPRTKDIVIQLPNTIVTDDAEAGPLVVKGTNAGTGLKRGLVVEKFFAGPGIIITSSHTVPNANPELAEHQGSLTISTTAAISQADVQVVSLDNAREEIIRGVIHHSLPVSILSSIRFKIKVPGAPGSGNKTVTLNMWILGTVAATLPDLTASYHILVPPGGGIVGPIPVGDTALPDVTLQAIDAPLKYFDASVDPIIVPAGSILHVQLTRNGDIDAYGGDVGLLYLTAGIS